MVGEVIPFSKLGEKRGEKPAASHIIAVGGGKGGIGKSFVSSNIALFLAKLGFKTLVIDLDLGAANVHTTLGVGIPPQGLGDFISGKEDDLLKVAVPTHERNLKLISGCNDDLDIANLNIFDRSRLMSHIYKLPMDFIILDLSAGTQQATIDFFLMAQTQIVTVTPDPSSIENAYRFMRAAFFRKVKRVESQLGLQEVLAKLMKDPHIPTRTPAELMRALQKENLDLAQALRGQLEHLDFKILLNQARTLKEAEIGFGVKSVCHNFFGLNVDFIGHLNYDNAAWQSLRRKKSFLQEFPQSALYSQFLQLAQVIAYPQRFKAVV